jgi:phospholipase C
VQVRLQGGGVVGSGTGPKLSATVIGTGRITTAALQSRIERLLGPRGSFIKIYGENVNGEALARLVITDTAAAESLGMHDVLDKALAGVVQDPPADAEDVQANIVYTLARKSENLAAGLKLEVKSLRVETIDVAIGPGAMLGASVPAIKLTVAVSGEAKVTFRGLTLATAKVRGGKFAMEVGIKLAPDGTPQVVTAVPDSPFDIDISDAVKAALLLTLGTLGLIGGMSVSEYIEHEINEAISDGAREMFSDPALAPRILMTIFGAHLHYRSIHIEGGTIVFDHVAPLEADPRPRAGYAGAIGRTMIEVTDGRPLFRPPLLLNTWAADNLSKIKHIVVVMMENRSYDHVLGYRARGATPDGADGLTDATIAAIQAANGGQYQVRALNKAGFAANALRLMTRIPKGVGHTLEDVREQLAGQAQRVDGGQINDPKGFVENFARERLSGDPLGLVPDDVLGYYEANDLPFYAYLAEHYGYCDRYYCSHPGPTLPNRMYSLTGDVQYDRFGAPILDNNHGDNFLLSRAATIYDLLTRKGVSWRVYESEPSVTMLRMFARYATNTTDIVPLARLESDVARGNLPAFTFIDPAMHHHPQDDDHPDADMHRGQIFLQRHVYNVLRSNPSLWQKTLLLITYDEHGGLYDHVVPPIADHLSAGSPGKIDARVVALAEALATGDEVEVGDARRLLARRPRPEVEPNPDGGDDDPDPGGGGGGRPQPGGGGRPQPGDDDEVPPVPSRDPVQIPYGVRVPTFVVSPWVKPGKGPSLTLDHCSILKTVLARFCGGSQPFLSDRVHASQSFEAFLTEPSPRMDVPPPGELGDLPIDVRRILPGASQIVTPPLSRKRMCNGDADFHEVSGWLARMLGR